jgi:hypothetical protein
MNFNDYRLEHDGLIICDPCLCITLFSNADLTVSDAPDMLGPYRAFMARFKNLVHYCVLDGNQRRAKKVTPDHFNDLPDKLINFNSKKNNIIVAEFYNGNVTEEIKAPAFFQDYRGLNIRPRSSVRISLPLEWFEKEGLHGLNQVLDECLQGFALYSGYIGYCFLHTTYGTHYRTTESYFSRWLLRHPGIMNPELAETQIIELGQGLPNLGWITFLGTGFIEKMGGEAALRQAVAPISQAHLHTYPNSVLGIRLGNP